MKAMSHDDNDGDDVDEENDDNSGHEDGGGGFNDNENYDAMTPMTFKPTYKISSSHFYFLF